MYRTVHDILLSVIESSAHSCAADVEKELERKFILKK